MIGYKGDNMIYKYKNTYKELLDIMEFDDQLGYFYEEVGELLQAINKHKRYNNNMTKFNIINEIVDVQIQLDILKIGYEIKQEDYNDIMFIQTEKIKKFIKNVKSVQ